MKTKYIKVIGYYMEKLKVGMEKPMKTTYPNSPGRNQNTM